MALPLLAMMARACPSARWALSTWIGAAFTTFFVKTAEAVQSVSDTMSATSFFHAAWVLTPTWIPAARKPWGAQTPPSIKFSIMLFPRFFRVLGRWIYLVLRIRQERGCHRFSPVVSSNPSIGFLFWTAAPDAPFPRLSNRAVIMVCAS